MSIINEREPRNSRPNHWCLSLSDAKLTLEEAKCEFGMTEVQYLGYQVSSCGLEPLAEGIQLLMYAPAPKCVSEVVPGNAYVLQAVPAERER